MIVFMNFIDNIQRTIPCCLTSQRLKRKQCKNKNSLHIYMNNYINLILLYHKDNTISHKISRLIT